MSEEDKKKEAIRAREFIKVFFDLITHGTLNKIKSFLNGLHDDEKRKVALNDTKEGRGRYPIHFAAARGDQSIFNYIYDLTDDKNLTDDEGNTVPFIAVQHDLLDFLKFLHGKGYDLKKARKGNVTLIHLAVSNGNVEMMDYLINQGVSVTTESEDLGAPLEWAIAYSQVAAAKFLFSKGCKMSNQNKNLPPGIHLAINTQCKEMIEILLQQGEDVYQAKDHEGWSTLHIAAEVGNLELCKRLSEKVDPNYRVKNQTALELAFCNDRWECVQFLKQITEHGELSKPVEVSPKVCTQEEKDQALALKEQGNKLFQESKFDEALEIYTQAIELNPHNEVFFSNRSACHFNKKDYKKALEDAAVAKSLKPDWPKAHFREGEAFFQLKNFCDAAASFWDALKLEPKNQTYKQGFDLSVKLGKVQYGNPN